MDDTPEMENHIKNIGSQQIAWLAGLLEGEGSFMWAKTSPCVAIQMTDRDVLERAAKIMAAKVWSPYKPKGKPSYKPIFTIRIFGIQAIQWMMTVYRFMGERRRIKIAAVIKLWRDSDHPPRASRNTPQFAARCHPNRPRRAYELCK